MGVAEDIKRISEQERRLVFEVFDEATAFDLGSLVRDRAVRQELGIVIDIRTWDRPLFYAAMPGSTGSNADWARRKVNTVRMFLKSTYRLGLEQSREDKTFPPGHGLAPSEFVLAGGGFPIAVKGAGVVGVIAVSGLPQRQDHELVVAVLSEKLGLDYETLALPRVES